MDMDSSSRNPASKARPGQRGNAPAPAGPLEDPFGLWLQRGLHQLYDSVAQEPIPPELLRLIEADRDQAEAVPKKPKDPG
jgi:hypothetical protein